MTNTDTGLYSSYNAFRTFHFMLTTFQAGICVITNSITNKATVGQLWATNGTKITRLHNGKQVWNQSSWGPLLHPSPLEELLSKAASRSQMPGFSGYGAHCLVFATKILDNLFQSPDLFYETNMRKVFIIYMLICDLSILSFTKFIIFP